MRDGATDAELTEMIRGIWTRRADRYSEERGAILRGEIEGENRDARVEMYQIGG